MYHKFPLHSFCFQINFIYSYSRPLDMIEQASISLHVTRHKRSASSQESIANFLTNPLNSINWNKNVNETIPFNKDRKVLLLQKRKNSKVPEALVKDKTDEVDTGDKDFIFSCLDCFGETQAAYHL